MCRQTGRGRFSSLRRPVLVLVVNVAQCGVLIDLGDEMPKLFMHDLGEKAAGVSGGHALRILGAGREAKELSLGP